MIIETEPVNSNLCQVVLHLASFHMEMSFIGSKHQAPNGRVLAEETSGMDLCTNCSWAHSYW